ncbi:MAG: DUF2892 domain-containing protein [Pseudomonadota bacterium]
MALEANVGRADQGVRIVIGAGMLSLLVVAPESGYWGLLGLLPLLTGIFRFCPTYGVLGIRTHRPRGPAADR